MYVRICPSFEHAYLCLNADRDHVYYELEPHDPEAAVTSSIGNSQFTSVKDGRLKSEIGMGAELCAVHCQQ